MRVGFEWSQAQETLIPGGQDGVVNEIVYSKGAIKEQCPLGLSDKGCHLRGLINRNERVGSYLCSTTVVHPDTRRESTVDVECSGPEKANALLVASLPGAPEVETSSSDLSSTPDKTMFPEPENALDEAPLVTSQNTDPSEIAVDADNASFMDDLALVRRVRMAAQRAAFEERKAAYEAAKRSRQAQQARTS